MIIMLWGFSCDGLDHDDMTFVESVYPVIVSFGVELSGVDYGSLCRVDGEIL